MQIKIQPDAAQKLTRMGDVTLFEPAGDAPQSEQKLPLDCVSMVQTPRGPKPLLKTMVTTACEKNCYYCPFRAGRGSTERLTFKPDELASIFDQMQRARVVDGLFLSSGIIKGGVTTQDKIIDTVEIVRRKFGYRGYIHLKIMPGAERDQIHRAMQIADRVSINLEGPTRQRLSQLAPKKDFDDELVKTLQWAGELKQASERKLASLVTQFVVGAVGDTDLELLSLSERLYRQVGLARAYYSAFSPVYDTPFETLPKVGPERERRLYQSSFLLRDYGWDVEDLPFVEAGNLRLDVDPKRAWADLHLRHNPVDLMIADRDTLLRVPGIGPQGADQILKARRSARLCDLGDLRQLGIRAPERSAPYVLLGGKRPPQQLALW
jgi:predicted DNA-binding helix-hairpin-helix protein